MTIKRIEQYAALKNEIKTLRGRISELQSKPAEVVRDVVSGSYQSFPYIKHAISIEEESPKRSEEISRLVRRLRSREKKMWRELEAIEEFIDTVDDSEVRQIIQLKYLQGLSWRGVSSRVYGYPSENRARMKIKRFFEKN